VKMWFMRIEIPYRFVDLSGPKLVSDMEGRHRTGSPSGVTIGSYLGDDLV
jgi:hypothetical protein